MSTLIAGRYRLESKIATGGMGEVWTARDQTLGRRVAVKLLRDALASDRVVAERFRREALTAASLSHPNMAEVYDYVEEKGRPGIVMELVDGHTLADRLRSGPLDPGEAIRIASAVLEALGAAHEAGIVHRDVKPGNIMLTPKGTVKVTDFGIARASGDSTLTETGAVMGTAHYAAPEQVQGRGATPASDLYSLGVVLYEGLTGRRPFEADTPVAAALARLTTDPPRPRRIRPDIPVSVETATMRALEREPAARYADAGAMRNALIGALAAAETEAMQTQMLPVTDATTAQLGGSAKGTDATSFLPSTPSEEPTRALGAAIPATPPAASSAPRRARRRGVPTAVAILVAIGLLTAAAGLVLMLRDRDRGPVMVSVPTLKNLTLQEALAEADRWNLNANVQSAYSSARQDTVISQSPAPGTELAEGDPILIVYSKGPPPCCTVPNLFGLTEDGAKKKLEDAGLELGEIRKETRRGAREGTVIEQSHDPNSHLARGGPVDIVIARKSKGNGGEGNRD